MASAGAVPTSASAASLGLGLRVPALPSENKTTDVDSDKDVIYDRLEIKMRDAEYSTEVKQVGQGVCHMLALRDRYNTKPTPNEDFDTDVQWAFEMVDGVMRVFDKEQKEDQLIQTHPYKHFAMDLKAVWKFCCSGPAKTVSHNRMHVLQKKYELYMLLNYDVEESGVKFDPKDFYNIHKVDNHIHLAAAMTSNHLLKFIKTKLMTEPEIPVDADGTTLRQLFDAVGLPFDQITIDALDSQGDYRMFHRFDNFNEAYNPFSSTKLRKVFLKHSNYIKGRYFGEIAREVLEKTGDMGLNVWLEPRVSVYGRERGEWAELAAWMKRSKLLTPRAVWVIQVPRIYPVWKKAKFVNNFEEMLDNVFTPLFEVTLNPSKDPVLAEFLTHVVGFDSVDDESAQDMLLWPTDVKPKDWDNDEQPPYSYYLYYMYANIRSLNALRDLKGLNTFALRPHCGESGPAHHLATAFLVADGINHGIKLHEAVSLQYLFYLCQIGISMSPLSNNVLFCELHKSPFAKLFQRGLNITLSTDDPMQFHTTSEPLIEEYTIAKQFWKLNVTDLSEIARNSVLQSGFSHQRKQQMLGDTYNLSGAQGNDVAKSNIPDCRASFRHCCRLEEYQYVWNASRARPMSNEISHNIRCLEGWKWLIAEVKAAHVWRAFKDYNLPDENGHLEYPGHLSFKKGEMVIVLSFDSAPPDSSTIKAYSQASPSAASFLSSPSQSLLTDSDDLWYGRDNNGTEGPFPKLHGTLLQRTMSMHFLFE